VNRVHYRRRIKAVFLVFVIFFFFCVARLFYIQFFRSDYLAEIARKQQNLYVELEPRRGNIYDVNCKPQAVNLAADSLYASPIDIPEKQKETIIRQLMQVLGVDYGYLKERLSRKKSFVWIARKISNQQSEAVKKLNIRWLGLIKESKRCYPNMYMASHVLGFSGMDNLGLDGIELYYDKYLRGKAGWSMIVRDARQKKLDLSEKMVPPIDGYDVVLTIDEVIQYIAERELDKVFTKYRAKGAMIIVMNPHTGEILALANRPTFDVNAYGATDKDARRNRAVTDLFEPGSVFKIVTASAALEEKQLSEEDRIFCENGTYRVASHILHDHEPHGWLTFREVIEESSNIGTTKIAQRLGGSTLFRFASLYGFGSKEGIDLPGEISGLLKEPGQWSKTSIGAVPIGQEVGVTALQLVSAISVIANGGQLMKPYIVKEIRDKRGEVIKGFVPTLLRKVISLETSARMKKILTGVIEKGTGKSAKLSTMSAAGKTGTGQKLEPNGAYSHSKFMASFIGFAPAEDPVIAIAVIVDEPRPVYYGGVVSAPVFKAVAEEVLKYLRTNQPVEKIIAFNETERAN
jgi:cell division protein FtsI/penicillin-binding protein 2